MDAVPNPHAADGEGLRRKLLALAYRMLGSIADAEDAVQDAYLRFQQASEIQSPEAWLVKATTRLCIDRLRQARRREAYVGPWLPEPIAHEREWEGMDRLEMAESLSTAFLVLLETLSPSERAAYLLREVFDYEFDEIAGLLNKTPVNVRQLTTRAKKRLGLKDRRFHPETGQADDLATRFFDACRSGDVHAIEALLTPDVTLYSDGGGKAFAAPKPILGSRRVAKLLSVNFRKRGLYCNVLLTTVNGQPGVVFLTAERAVQITTFTIDQGGVTTMYTVLNPDKLRHWPSAIPNVADEPTTKEP